jgi:hypothetical protein
VHNDLGRAIFELDGAIRYVSFGEGQHIRTRERTGLAGASDAISDRFEELFVNPALVTLARQRGELDCGGLRYLLVAYGHFTQLVVPYRAGHASVAIEPTADVVAIADAVLNELHKHDEATSP